ncbi:ABC transporter substrate-binding protein [Nocardiopsis nanhaiensis]
MPPTDTDHTPRSWVLTATGLTLTLALTACATLSSGTDRDSDPETISTAISTDVEATLTLAYADDPPAPELVAGFQTIYPNVNIELQHTAFVDYIATINAQMSGDAPDIAQYNAGAMRSLVPGEHLLNLDEYAQAYGWDESIPVSTVDTLTLTEDAEEYGSGSLYAVPGALSVLGVFYNPTLLEEAGVSEPPTTLDELEDTLTAVDEAGIEAFSVGGLETGANFVWCSLLNAIADPDEYRAWVYGSPEASIDTDGALEATETFARWVERGYVPSGANAVSDEDAQAAFVNGESAFLISGNWAALALEAEMEDEVSFFLMPGESADQAPVASGSSVAYTLSSTTEHPDVAAAFLNYLVSPEAARIQVETGFMPVDLHADTEAYGLLNTVNHGFDTVAGADSIVPFPDIAAPGILDEVTSGVQGLIAQEDNPDDFLAGLQHEWAQHNDA